MAGPGYMRGQVFGSPTTGSYGRAASFSSGGWMTCMKQWARVLLSSAPSGGSALAGLLLIWSTGPRFHDDTMRKHFTFERVSDRRSHLPQFRMMGGKRANSCRELLLGTRLASHGCSKQYQFPKKRRCVRVQVGAWCHVARNMGGRFVRTRTQSLKGERFRAPGVDQEKTTHSLMLNYSRRLSLWSNESGPCRDPNDRASSCVDVHPCARQRAVRGQSKAYVQQVELDALIARLKGEAVDSLKPKLKGTEAAKINAEEALKRKMNGEDNR